MDESIKIYAPSHRRTDDILFYDSTTNTPFYANRSNIDKLRKTVQDVEKFTEPKKTPPKHSFEKESYFDTLKRVFIDHQVRESKLASKHPWVPILYNWFIIAAVIALFVGFFLWGMDIHIRQKAEALTATAMAEVQAEADAKEAARLEALAAEQASEDYIVRQMATEVAKLYYGAKNFEENYHYEELDFSTYSRGAFNRVENSAYPNDLIEVIRQKGQWVGYNENNPVIDRYYKMAEKHVRAWRAETTKPISNDYVYAELTEHGIYLKNDFNANGYARRWRAES